MNRLSVLASKAAVDNRVSDSEFRTMAVIAAHSNKESDGWCYPSYRLIGELRGLNKRTIQTHVKKLRKLGYLRTETREREDGGQTSNWIQVRYDFERDPRDEEDPPPMISRGSPPPGSPRDHPIKDKQTKDKANSSTNESSKTNGKIENGSQPNLPLTEKESPIGDSKPRLNSHQQALHELETLFCDLTGLKPPPRTTQKQRRAAGARWWGPLGTIYSHLADKDLTQAKRIVTLATTRMKNDNLTITAPQSIEQVANAVYAEISSKSAVIAENRGGALMF